MQDLKSSLESRSYPDPNTGCTLFFGSGVKGYGRIKVMGKNILVHRLVYFASRGIPYADTGLILHKCDTRACVNPGHLYMGDHRSNGIDTRDRKRHPWHNKKVCVHGHSLTPENIYTYRGARSCKICHNIKVKEYNRRKREKFFDIINART